MPVVPPAGPDRGFPLLEPKAVVISGVNEYLRMSVTRLQKMPVLIWTHWGS